MDQGTIAMILGALWAVSELLAFIPAIKANSIFQMIRDLLKTLRKKKIEDK